MRLSTERLTSLASATGFQNDTLEKVVRLGEVLAEINRHPFLRDRLALKGGTALNMFFGPPPRMSVDLDFNYVGAVEVERMKEERPKVERALERIAAGGGYPVQKGKVAHAGQTLYLGYRNASGRADRIEIDVTFLNRVPLVQLVRRRMWQPDGEGPEALLVGVEELVAGKLRALLDRDAPRDYYDADRLPNLLGDVFATERFRRLFLIHTGVLDRPVTSYAIEEGRLSDQTVETVLWPMLTGVQRPTAPELERRAREVVTPLLRLDRPEEEFVRSLNTGAYRPEILFPDEAEFVERLRLHPALRWKADNAARHHKDSVPPLSSQPHDLL